MASVTKEEEYFAEWLEEDPVSYIMTPPKLEAAHQKQLNDLQTQHDRQLQEWLNQHNQDQHSLRERFLYFRRWLGAGDHDYARLQSQYLRHEDHLSEIIRLRLICLDGEYTAKKLEMDTAFGQIPQGIWARYRAQLEFEKGNLERQNWHLQKLEKWEKKLPYLNDIVEKLTHLADSVRQKTESHELAA